MIKLISIEYLKLNRWFNKLAIIGILAIPLLTFLMLLFIENQGSALSSDKILKNLLNTPVRSTAFWLAILFAYNVTREFKNGIAQNYMIIRKSREMFLLSKFVAALIFGFIAGIIFLVYACISSYIWDVQIELLLYIQGFAVYLFLTIYFCSFSIIFTMIWAKTISAVPIFFAYNIFEAIVTTFITKKLGYQMVSILPLQAGLQITIPQFTIISIILFITYILIFYILSSIILARKDL